MMPAQLITRMIIPEFTSKPADIQKLASEAEFKTVRAATTDKALAILMTAEWDAASQQLKAMLAQMPAAYPKVKFLWVDCDECPDLLEMFDVEVVPTLVLAHPHKTGVELVRDLTPEVLAATVAEQHKFYCALFEQEKQKAFRDIEALIATSPCFMFIKGTLDAPKCKFTRQLVATLKPFKYRAIRTFNILENERIRQWLKFYSDWPTFPQVFANGKFLGGIDIIIELVDNNELTESLPDACLPLTPEQQLAELNALPLVVYMTQADEEDKWNDLLAAATQFSKVKLWEDAALAALVTEPGLFV